MTRANDAEIGFDEAEADLVTKLRQLRDRIASGHATARKRRAESRFRISSGTEATTPGPRRAGHRLDAFTAAFDETLAVDRIGVVALKRRLGGAMAPARRRAYWLMYRLIHAVARRFRNRERPLCFEEAREILAGIGRSLELLQKRDRTTRTTPPGVAKELDDTERRLNRWWLSMEAKR